MRAPLLYLSHLLPFPPDSGARIRGHHLLSELAREWRIRALCFGRGPGLEGRGDEARAWAAGEGIDLAVFPVRQSRSRPRLLLDHVRCALRGVVYTRCAYRSSAFEEALRDALGEGPALVHVDSLDLAGYMPLLHRIAPGVGVALDHHNVESDLLADRGRKEDSAVVGRYLSLQARRYRDEERRWIPRVGLNVAVSEADRVRLEEIGGGGRFHVAPNGVDTDYFRPLGAHGRSVAFLGGTDWAPNVEGMEFFGREVLPLLRERGFDRRVLWIGRATPREQEAYRERYGFELPGYVEDVRDAVRDVACTIVPLRTGSGTRLKITTAWGMGLPVVSTTVGASGLETRHGHNALVADDAPSFAAAVMRVLEDEELRERLGREGRATAEAVYSWRHVGAELRAAYRGLAAG